MDLLNKLRDEFDQAELLKKETNELKISLENWDLQDITSENLSRSSLRVIKEGKKGANTTFGNSEKIQEKLLDGARESVQYGDKAIINFSDQKSTDTSTSLKEFKEIDSDEIFTFIKKFVETVKEKKDDFPLDLQINKKLEEIELLTTNGADLKEKLVNFSLSFGAPIPGGGSQIYRTLEQPQFFTEVPENLIDDFIREYEKTTEVSIPETGKMPVLFSPRALYFLFICLEEGISGRNIYRETSPLLDKKGEKIFSDKLNIVDKPAMERSSRKRTFDDEGIPTTRQDIVSDGILKKFIYDLEYAERLGEKAQGNGLKQALFGSGIDTPVTPSLINPVIIPGDKSKEELMADIDEGILVDGIIGFHSSNYTQGHFSVQAHGFHIKEGKLQGRLQDVMIAGNIYKDFKNIREIGSKLYPAFKGYTPYILVDDINVTGK